MSVITRAPSRAVAHRAPQFRRTLRRTAVALTLVVGVVATALAVQPRADAATVDAANYPLKFAQASRSAVSPSGATGRTVGDVIRYAGVATIDGTVIDAVVTTVSLSNATIDKIDEGSAVSTPPPGSSQTVDDLFMPNLSASANPGAVVFEFSFYEGGTYTGAGTGVPVTLTDVKVNTYDIDANGSSRQFNDFRGFQTYLSYSQDGTHGLNVTDNGNGFARFEARAAVMSDATSGAYSWARAQVNYDRVETMSARLGQLGSGVAYFALDFSAGGIWTTNGTTVVTPSLGTNPANRPPTTADVSISATRDAATVLLPSDFPFGDPDDNALAGVTIVTAPNPSTGRLEHSDGSTWTTVADGTTISPIDIENGRLRIVPTGAATSFTFTVSDGLVSSAASTFTATAPTGAQTVTFPNPGTKNGGTSQTFASGALASSGPTPILSSQTPGVCTVSGLDITVLALPVGVTTATCVIAANQPGDASYGRAVEVVQQFLVDRRALQTITFADPADRAYDSADIASNASSSSGLTVTLTSSTTSICTVSGLTIRPVAPGDCTVTASQAGNASYVAATPVTQTVTLGKLPQAITFAQPTSDQLAHGSRTVTPSTDASGLTPTLASSTTAVCTVSGTTVTYVGLGDCTLTASQPGNATYSAATDATRTFSVTKTPQAITFPALPTAAVGTGSIVLGATTTATGLAVGYTSSSPSVCTVAGSTVTLVGAGTCRLVASQPGDATYAAATTVTRTFDVVDVATTNLPSGRAGAPYSAQLSAAGGTGTGTWSTRGPLPAGLTLDPTTGMLSGTPTAPFSGSVTFLYEEDGAVQEVVLALDLDTLALDPAAAGLAATGLEIGPWVVGALATLLVGVGALALARVGRRTPPRHRA